MPAASITPVSPGMSRCADVKFGAGVCGGGVGQPHLDDPTRGHLPDQADGLARHVQRPRIDDGADLLVGHGDEAEELLERGDELVGAACAGLGLRRDRQAELDAAAGQFVADRVEPAAVELESP